MKYAKALISFSLVGGLALSGLAVAGDGGRISISPSLQSVEVMHQGKAVTISRSTDKDAVIPKAYAKISRPCPPFLRTADRGRFRGGDGR